MTTMHPAHMCLTVILFVFVSFPVFGQDAASSLSPQATYDSANVVVNGQVLFKVIGVSSSPAKKRAKRIANRIEALAEDPTFDPENIAIRVEDDRTLLVAGDQRIMTIRNLDAMGEGVNRRTLADIYQKKIKRVIVAYRHDREPEVVSKNLIYIIVASTILVALVFGVFVFFRYFTAFLDRHFKKRMEKLEAQSKRIVQAEQIWNLLIGFLKLSKVLLVLLLLYIYLHSVLSLFPWTRYIAKSLINYSIEPVLVMARAFIDYLPKLFFLIILILLVRYLMKLNRIFFAAVARSRIRFENFDAEWAWPTYRIVKVVMLVFAVVIAYPYIPGSDSAAFKGISLLFGVLISLGSTSMLSNIIAGYTMIYRRTFKMGDRVKIGDNIGDVLEMRLLVTHLRSLKNENIVVPNSLILNNEVTNYSAMALEEGLILHTMVGIGYEVPWRQVEAMLLMAAARTPGLNADKKPFVLQKSLGDFAVTYELNAFCDDASKMTQLYSELHCNIQDVFNEYDVQIMTPAYESDTPEPKTVPKAKWFTAPAQAPSELPSPDLPK
ncbi:MAG: mechanosensitive ion channel [Gammaproteobacteria bacterium]|jgi:small-conductance mechanosensitive channel